MHEDDEQPSGKTVSITEALEGLGYDIRSIQGTASPKREIWERRRDDIAFWINLAVSVSTMVALVFAGVQIKQANDAYVQAARQFAASGSTYSWFGISPFDTTLTQEGEHMTMQVAFGAVISNHGRTGDTIVAVSDPNPDDGLRVCIVESDGGGGLNPDTAALDGTIRLEPGESRFVILTTKRVEAGTIGRSRLRFTVPNELVVHKADGSTSKAVNHEEVSREALRHYGSQRGFDESIANCERLAER